jgi:hypothetical protein
MTKLEISENEENIVTIFVPISIKRRGGTAMIIDPRNAKRQDGQKYFDRNMIKAIAKAYKWKRMLEEEKVQSLADLARKENVSTGYVSKIFNLNFLSPKIVKDILSGTQPRDLKLQDIVSNRKMPDLWQEQEENWGF